jgi:hypothetical protein
MQFMQLNFRCKCVISLIRFDKIGVIGKFDNGEDHHTFNSFHIHQMLCCNVEIVM